MQGRVGVGLKPIPAPPHGTGLKSNSIPTAPLLQGGKNLHGVKWGETGQAGWGKLPSLLIVRLNILQV